MARILVIDDEPQLLRAVSRGLAADDHEVLTAATGALGLELASTADPHVVIVDLGLPDVPGDEVIRRLRGRSAVPIVVLSGAGTEASKVCALDAGADDYVLKPFGHDELRARLRAILRRTPPEPLPPPPVRDFGAVCLDPGRQLVMLDGLRLHLTPTEYALLDELTAHPGALLDHASLLRAVWGRTCTPDTRQYLRVYVGQLRDKLGDAVSAPRFIATEPGVGYRWLPEPVGA
jgi:two-component system KDP operon response regulator KdpE